MRHFWHTLSSLFRAGLNLERLIEMSAELQAKIDTLQSDVEALTTAENSAITLLQGLSAQLSAALAAAADAGATEAQLAALSDLDTTLKGGITNLANAVASNTPGAQPAPPEPTPDPVPETSAATSKSKSSDS